MSSSTTFDQYQAGSVPATLKGPYGEAFTSLQGIVKDGFAEGAIQAVKARFAGTAPEDSLQYIGQERLLTQGPTESAAAYRARLLAAWAAWAQAGTRTGIIAALNALGYPNVAVIEDNKYNIASSPPATGFSPGAEWWRFMVVINQPHAFTLPSVYGDGNTWGNGRKWGIGGPPGAIDAIRAVINLWKPPHAQLVNLIIAITGNVWGASGTWGSNTWGGVAAYL